MLGASLCVLIMPGSHADIHFVAGQYSPYTLYSEIDFSGVDTIKTKELQEKVAGQAPYYFKIMTEDTTRITERFQEFFTQLKILGAAEAKGGAYLPVPGNKIDLLAGHLNKNTMDCLLQIADNSFR